MFLQLNFKSTLYFLNIDVKSKNNVLQKNSHVSMTNWHVRTKNSHVSMTNWHVRTKNSHVRTKNSHVSMKNSHVNSTTPSKFQNSHVNFKTLMYPNQKKTKSPPISCTFAFIPTQNPPKIKAKEQESQHTPEPNV